MVFFDLPVQSKSQRRAAARFRNFLLKDGYHMIQYSVYGRVCNGYAMVDKHKQRVRQALPFEGSVRLLTITEKQYQSMAILLGSAHPDEGDQENKGLEVF